MNKRVNVFVILLVGLATRCGVGQTSDVAEPFVASTRTTIDFESQVLPAMTKLGCNSGSCHGSAAGRGGFSLSLYGSKPDSDYDAITRENRGRRINKADVEQSLFLRKPGGELNHGGEQLFELDDPVGKLLVGWIEQGASRGGQSLAQFDVKPKNGIVEDLAQPLQLQSIARFEQGIAREVTRWTRFESSDSSAVTIDEETGLAKFHRRGRHIIIARFMDRVQPMEIIVPLDRPEPDLSNAPRNNFIDQFVYRKLKQLHIEPAGPASDEVFLRRVTIDLTGRLPSIDQIRDFQADSSADKRDRYIDRLIGSDAYTDYWTFLLARQLRLRSQPGDTQGVRVYHQWLRQQVAKNVGWNRVSRDLVNASGDSHKIGPANFFRTTSNPKLQAEFLTESLLGVRLRCANCHDHPLDRWTQDDYHGLAAILAKTQQGRVIREKPAGQVIHPANGQPAKERIPGDQFIESTGGDQRVALSEWLTDKQNPYFAKAMVNRIWASLMGDGMINPVDDLRATNPPSHPQLLDRLAAEFIKHDYDLQHIIQLICRSAAYQRKSAVGKTDPLTQRYFAVASIRQLPAEVVADAIDDVTGVAQKYVRHPQGTRAIQLQDAAVPSPVLDILGRCSRIDSCETPQTGSSGELSKQLHLINGKLINEKLANQTNRLQKMLREGKSTDEIVREFYLRCLGHPPTAKQATFWQKQLDRQAAQADKKLRQQLLEDFVWSLLTCREFLTNH